MVVEEERKVCRKSTVAVGSKVGNAYQRKAVDRRAAYKGRSSPQLGEEDTEKEGFAGGVLELGIQTYPIAWEGPERERSLSL